MAVALRARHAAGQQNSRAGNLLGQQAEPTGIADPGQGRTLITDSGVDAGNGAALRRAVVPEVTVASLDAHQQRLVENAQQALALGQLDYVVAVGAELLRAAPGCLAVRRLQRVAQLRSARGGCRLARKLAAFLGACLSRASGHDAAEALKRAEALLARDPTSVPALRRLAAAAARLDLPETAAFALVAIRELEPGNRANLLALGRAWLAAGQPGEALAVAEGMLAAVPGGAGAQALLRDASVALAVAQGRWEAAGSFREKLRN